MRRFRLTERLPKAEIDALFRAGNANDTSLVKSVIG